MHLADLISQVFKDFFLPGAVGAIGAGIVLLAARTFVTEKIKGQIKSEYDHQLEIHKTKLASQSAVEIEKLKSRLGATAAERQLRFAKLHERRAEVIAKSYELLKALQSAMIGYVNIAQTGNSTDDERRKMAANAYNSFFEYLRTNAIFLPKETAQKLEALRLVYVKNFIGFQYGVANAEGDKDRINRWVQISDEVEKLSTTVIEELEDELRRLLGDNGLVTE